MWLMKTVVILHGSMCISNSDSMEWGPKSMIKCLSMIMDMFRFPATILELQFPRNSIVATISPIDLFQCPALCFDSQNEGCQKTDHREDKEEQQSRSKPCYSHKGRESRQAQYGSNPAYRCSESLSCGSNGRRKDFLRIDEICSTRSHSLGDFEHNKHQYNNRCKYAYSKSRFWNLECHYSKNKKRHCHSGEPQCGYSLSAKPVNESYAQKAADYCKEREDS